MIENKNEMNFYMEKHLLETYYKIKRKAITVKIYFDYSLINVKYTTSLITTREKSF